MRLIKLEIEKYGAFEGRVLTFRPDARLHVVHGPNEAGKSSALSAIGDLLFGFGQRTDFAFRHATGDLRLGAIIAASDGTELSFRRRKGKAGTLIGADEKPLRDDLLVPFLGQLSRETFERAFGLTSEALREGADDLLKGDGDGAASLFAAASGLRGVETLRRALEEEADARFSPQARTRPFNDLAKRFEAAQKAVREHELGASRWKRLNEEIEALEERHRALEADRARARTERARLERLARAHDASVELAGARRALEEFGEAPQLASDAAREIADLLERSEEAERALGRAVEALRLAEADVARVEFDEAALGAAAEIEALVRESGAFGKTREDLPRVRREAEEIDEDLVRLARRLGLSDGASVETAMPTDAARDDLAELLRQGREIALARETAARAEADERSRLEALAAERGDAEIRDPKPLRESFAALSPRLRSLEGAAELQAEHAHDVDALAEAAARLSPPVADLERIAARPAPAAEWIAGRRRELERIGRERGRLDDLAKSLGEEARKVEAELSRLASDGVIASPETIREAREAREAAWLPLRAALGGGPPAGDVRPYERAVAEADRLADRLAEDARRAARKAELDRRADEIARSGEAASDERATLDGANAEFSKSWRATWLAFGVEPGAPDEMEGWRKGFEALVERRDGLRRREDGLARLKATEVALAPELKRLAAACGVEAPSGAEALWLGARIASRLDGLADAFRSAAALAAQIADAERRAREAARRLEEISAREGSWRARWLAALPRLGLAGDASFGAVEAALSAWREAPGLLGQRTTLARRVRGMERDAASFGARVAELVAGFAAELADLPAQTAAERLGRRLTEARAAEARREDAVRRRDEAAKALDRAERAGAEAAASLERVSADLGPAQELKAVLARIERRSLLAREAAERRDQLLRLGGAQDEAALLAELEGFSPDAAPAGIERLEGEERRVDLDAQQAWAELHTARAEREALGGAEAEQAAAEGRAAGAALYETAREWSVAKLASLLLGAAIERARAEDRSPTLDRAGSLFGTLTGGAFAGFAENYEDDALMLFGRRASGETVPVKGMSEGTRDQFYLALRLAALEDYAARAEAAPFIGDDLFASFDDARTASGLRALAEIGASVQSILFTHHRAVVDAARRGLGEAVDVIEIDAIAR